MKFKFSLIALLSIFVVTAIPAFAQTSPTIDITGTVTSNSITAQWNDAYDSYDVSWRGGGTTGSVTVTEPSHTISDLFPGVWYEITVSSGTVTSSEAFTTTGTQFQESLSVTPTDTSIAITWDDPEDLYSEYRVSVNARGGESKYYTTSDHTFTAYYLTADTDYRVRVIPLDEPRTYWDRASIWTSTTNDGTSTTPDRINNLRISNVLANGFTADWDNIAGTSYNVKIVGGGEETTLESTSNRHIAIGLRPGVWYNFIVTLPDSDVEVSQSLITANTAFQNSLNVVPSSTSLAISWDATEHNSFSVRVNAPGEKPTYTTVTTDTLTVEGLDPDTQYRVRVVPDGVYWDRADTRISTTS